MSKDKAPTKKMAYKSVLEYRLLTAGEQDGDGYRTSKKSAMEVLNENDKQATDRANRDRYRMRRGVSGL